MSKLSANLFGDIFRIFFFYRKQKWLITALIFGYQGIIQHQNYYGNVSGVKINEPQTKCGQNLIHFVIYIYVVPLMKAFNKKREHKY